MPQLEHVLASQDMVGECPYWNINEQALYWVDILGNRFHRYHPTTGKWDTYTVDKTMSIGAIAPGKSGDIVMATSNGFARYNLTTKEISFIIHPKAHLRHMRFNDGSVDAQGRFWAGTMSMLPEKWELLEGKLYRLDPDESVHAMDTDYALINGIGWSPDNTAMYVVDSARKLVYRFDFDLLSGKISNRRTFLDTTDEMGVPDGLAVDQAGNLWIAFWDGWNITCFDREGTRLSRINLPVQCPASCTFGGADLDELYITSAWDELNEEQRVNQPLAGDIFRMKMDVPGLAQHLFLG